MKITDIECHVVVVPDVAEDACSSAQDDIIVVIRTDEGLTGVGETDTNPWVARAMIQAKGTHCMARCLSDLLIGEDPLNVEALWDKLYVQSAMTGRRGLGICAIGALDMALWDLRGKALGVPCWQLLGGAKQPHIVPYASLLPDGDTIEQYRNHLVERALQAKQAGFRAAKMEVCLRGPYSHNGLQESDATIVETVAACREAIGPDMTMMVDVVYGWPDAKQALHACKRLEPYDLFFLETPLPVDDVDGHAFLADHTPIRIASGEWLTTRHEFIDLLDRGRVDVAQPDIGRVGGLTEARRVAELAGDRGRLMVPHCWKTGIGIAASAHLAAATAHCPFIEYLPPALCDSALRRDVADEGLTMTDGVIALPDRPGLGVELNMDTIERYRDA